MSGRNHWRTRCPQGHCDYRKRQDGTIFCRACGAAYSSDVDWKHRGNKVGVETFDDIHRLTERGR